MDKVLENSMWFQENHKELYAKYPNKYLVIVNKNVVKSFDSSHDAFIFAKNNYKIGDFCIPQCKKDICELLL